MHFTIFERIQVIHMFKSLSNTYSFTEKSAMVSKMALEKDIKIPDRAIRSILNKWLSSSI